MNALERKLIDKLGRYQDTAPVYRIEPRPLDELEKSAAQLACRVAGQDEDGRSHISRSEGRSEFLLSAGLRARAYHASGAMAVNAGLAPMTHLLGDKVDKGGLTEAAVATAKRLGLDRLGSSGEKLTFERLWQIKAAGINRERVRGREVVCRAIGAFRRYVGDLPVYGRASVVIELAGDAKIGGVAVDWRPLATEVFDRAKVLDPEHAARAIVADIGGRVPGGEIGDKDFDVTMFSLGYISLPKRRAQGLLAPVYVAMLERVGWTTMNHVIVVNGTEKVYENIGRLNASPPRVTARPPARASA
jgi:hypothetical protein